MSKDKNEIVPSDDDSIDGKIEFKSSDEVEKFIREFFKKYPNSAFPVLVPRGENTHSIKLDYVFRLLWTINERLDKIESKLGLLESRITDIYDWVYELYDSYLCDE